MNKKSTALVNVANEESLALLNQQFPVNEGFQRTFLPRLGMFSQDRFEGKGKAAKLTQEAGMFYTEKQTEEEDENGKKIWEKTELGTEIEGIIVFQRKALRYYDSKLEQYTSSPIFDSNDDIVPLFCNKQEVARGTPAELKARPEYRFEKDGKIKSKLEDNKVLYVLYDGELYQMTLRGSSMYSYMSYTKTGNPSTVITKFNSEPKEKGEIEWNQMTFIKVRDLNQKEAEEVIAKQQEIMSGINEEKRYFASISGEPVAKKDELDDFN